MPTGPQLVAVDGELARVESAVDGDPQAAIAEARTGLENFDARAGGSRTSHLDDADAALLRAQERVTGEPARRLEAIRNRLRIYRDAIDRTGEDLAVIDATARAAGEESIDIADHRGRTVELVATVVNVGRPREATVVVELYDETGDRLEEVVSPSVRLPADEEVPVEIELAVPEAAAYYGVAALDAETETVG